MGVATGDIDNDGWTDLYITGYPRCALYRNNGDGSFSDITERAGVAGEGWAASAGFFDYDRDGNLDLFVTRYLDWSFAKHIRCGSALPSYCNPDRFAPVSNILYRNRGNGTFEDISRASGIGAHTGKGLGVAFCDYDQDGWPDVFVANDGVAQLLFHNNGDGTFRERALEAGVAYSDDGKAYAGMGTDFGDYDNDGRADLVVTNLAGEIYALYHNEGGGLFRYSSLTTGLARITAGSSGWGVRWADFDNDGWKDLFLAQGHVLDNIERLEAARRYKESPALIRNLNGQFQTERLEGVTAVAGRGAAFGDLDNDGSMDVVVGILGEKPLVFRNAPSSNHWLILRLAGNRSNRDGVGASVRVNGQVGYASSAGSYLSANDARLHFGLGSKRTATVEIRWPSGAVQELQNVEADQVLVVKEP